jgi:hypothetical protein
MIDLTQKQIREIAECPATFRDVARERVAFLRRLRDYAWRQGADAECERFAGEAEALEAAVRGLGDK